MESNKLFFKIYAVIGILVCAGVGYYFYLYRDYTAEDFFRELRMREKQNEPPPKREFAIELTVDREDIEKFSIRVLRFDDRGLEVAFDDIAQLPQKFPLEVHISEEGKYALLIRSAKYSAVSEALLLKEKTRVPLKVPLSQSARAHFQSQEDVVSCRLLLTYDIEKNRRVPVTIDSKTVNGTTADFENLPPGNYEIIVVPKSGKPRAIAANLKPGENTVSFPK